MTSPVFTGSAWIMSSVGQSDEALFFRAGVKNTFLKLTSVDGDEQGILEISASNFSINSAGNVTIKGDLKTAASG